MTNRSRICCATVTPRGNRREKIALRSASVQTFLRRVLFLCSKINPSKVVLRTVSVQRLTEVPNGAPAAGPYSLGVIAEGKFLYVSGQGPYDPATGGLVRGDIAKQTELVLQSVKHIVEAAGVGLENIVSCRVYLQPLTLETFQAMNAVYAQFFGPHKPARTTIGATLLNMDVEIDAIVVLD